MCGVVLGTASGGRGEREPGELRGALRSAGEALTLAVHSLGESCELESLEFLGRVHQSLGNLEPPSLPCASSTGARGSARR